MANPVQSPEEDPKRILAGSAVDYSNPEGSSDNNRARISSNSLAEGKPSTTDHAHRTSHSVYHQPVGNDCQDENQEVFDSLDSLKEASNTLLPPFKTVGHLNEPFEEP